MAGISNLLSLGSLGSLARGGFSPRNALGSFRGPSSSGARLDSFAPGREVAAGGPSGFLNGLPGNYGFSPFGLTNPFNTNPSGFTSPFGFNPLGYALSQSQNPMGDLLKYMGISMLGNVIGKVVNRLFGGGGGGGGCQGGGG